MSRVWMMGGLVQRHPEEPWWVRALVHVVRDVGFPIMVAAYLLFRLDGQLAMLVAEQARTNGLLETMQRARGLNPTRPTLEVEGLRRPGDGGRRQGG